MEEKERNLITTRLGHKIEDFKDPRDRLGGFTYPSKIDRHDAVAMYLVKRDLRVRVFPQSNHQGVHIILLGESTWSRPIGIHLADPAGVIYMLSEADGDFRSEIDVTVKEVFWLARLVKTKSFSELKRLFGAPFHSNARLAYVVGRR